MKSFYMRDNDDKETVAAFDLLVPGVYDMMLSDAVFLWCGAGLLFCE